MLSLSKPPYNKHKFKKGKEGKRITETPCKATYGAQFKLSYPHKNVKAKNQKRQARACIPNSQGQYMQALFLFLFVYKTIFSTVNFRGQT